MGTTFQTALEVIAGKITNGRDCAARGDEKKGDAGSKKNKNDTETKTKTVPKIWAHFWDHE